MSQGFLSVDLNLETSILSRRKVLLKTNYEITLKHTYENIDFFILDAILHYFISSSSSKESVQMQVCRYNNEGIFPFLKM